MKITENTALRETIAGVVDQTPVIDIHTHLFPAQFGALNLFGIDELLTYHYLIAEMFRFARISPAEFWNLNKTEQADLVWRTLFVENTPLSEASRGVITVLDAFGLDTSANDLSEIRRFFQTRNISEHPDRVLKIARVSDVVMTNDPFDVPEAAIWQSGKSFDARFHAALRMDVLLNDWPAAAEKLKISGYQIDANLNEKTTGEIRRFLGRWIHVMKPLYMAVSLPDDFEFPASDMRDEIIRKVVLPTAREHDLPFALMIGVRRNVNPALRAAGDGVGRADVKSLEKLCAENPDVKFLATFLSRENQHELCVAARKFSNLLPFGCWWFLNNPSIIAEITRERIELLGTSFIPQHSDARVLEQLIYKWKHSRRIISEVLFESYERLTAAGRKITKKDIERDVTGMFSGNFQNWTRITKSEVPSLKSKV